MYEVGLGDSPMRISRKLNGNPYRYAELVAANPHKSIVHVDGMATFKSLGVGEQLIVPNGFVGDGAVDGWLTDALSAVASVVTAPARVVVKAATGLDINIKDIKVPILGDVVNIVDAAIMAPVHLVTNIASGARLDKALVSSFKEHLKVIKDVAPYAQAVVSFVPGIGTGVAAAIGAGSALAEGQSITEAAKSAIRGALPGGAIATAAYDTALKVASGANVGQAALESARNLIPDGPARKAFDVGLAVVTGEKIQTALAHGLASLAPDAMKTILGAGTKALAATPVLSNLAKTVSGAPLEGVKLAAGLLSQTGINEKALSMVRNQITPEIRKGFDAALSAQADKIAWLKNVVSAPVLTPAQALQELAKLTPDQQKQLIVIKQLQDLAKLTPDQQQQLIALKKARDAAIAAGAPKMPEPPKKAAPMPAPKPAPKMPTPAPKAAPKAAPKMPEPAKKATPAPTPTTPAAASGPARLAYAPYPAHMQTGALSGVPAPSCRSLGAPLTDMPHGMHRAGLAAVSGTGGRPRMVHGPDGRDYLFALENGSLTARQCFV